MSILPDRQSCYECPECGTEFWFCIFKSRSPSEARSRLYKHLRYEHGFDHDEAFEAAGC